MPEETEFMRAVKFIREMVQQPDVPKRSELYIVYEIPLSGDVATVLSRIKGVFKDSRNLSDFLNEQDKYKDYHYLTISTDLV
jgi:hypothetical protein